MKLNYGENSSFLLATKMTNFASKMKNAYNR